MEFPARDTSVGVFCGSRPGVRGTYVELAREFGAALGRRGSHLIYGAGSVGIMGAVAEAALAAGGSVTGVIPEHLYSRERPDYIPGQVFVVSSMHKRKALMYYMSTAFAILPGGLGTMDELMEVATWNQLGIHRKRIVLINFHGFFDPLLATLDHIVTEGFLGPPERNLIHTAPDVPAALDLLFQRIPPDQSDKSRLSAAQRAG